MGRYPIRVGSLKTTKSLTSSQASFTSTLGGGIGVRHLSLSGIIGLQKAKLRPSMHPDSGVDDTGFVIMYNLDKEKGGWVDS